MQRVDSVHSSAEKERRLQITQKTNDGGRDHTSV